MPWRQITVVAYLLCALVTTAAGLGGSGAEVRAGVTEDAWLRTSWARDVWSMRPADRFTHLAAETRCAVSRTEGDFDGDGGRDVALVYARAEPCDYAHAEGRYRLDVLLSSGGRLVRKLGPRRAQDTSVCLPICTAFAAPDFNVDGRDELAVLHGHGASQVWFGVYAVTGTSLRRLVVDRGGNLVPAEFRFFGSLCCGADLVCRTAQDGTPLVVQSYSGRGAWNLHYEEDVYAFSGRAFVFRSSRVETRSLFAQPTSRGRRCLRPSEHFLGSDPRVA